MHKLFIRHYFNFRDIFKFTCFHNFFDSENGSKYYYTNADDAKNKSKGQGLSFSATSSSTMKLYIHAMAFFDIGYLASLSSLTYYSSKSDGYGYHTEYQDEVFYLILPTCNIFKGTKTINQSL